MERQIEGLGELFIKLIEEIKNKNNNNIYDKSWETIFIEFLEQDEGGIYKQIIDDAKNKKDNKIEKIRGILEQLGSYVKGKNTQNIVPKITDIFEVFKTPFDKIELLILGQDPYPAISNKIDEKGNKITITQANGLAFSWNTDKKKRENSFGFNKKNVLRNLNDKDSLKYIFKALKEASKKNENVRNLFLGDERNDNDTNKWDRNLEDWTKKGILLLNSALTIGKGINGKGKKCNISHFNIWKPFTTFIIREIIKDRLTNDNEDKKKLAIMLWGKEALSFFMDSIKSFKEDNDGLFNNFYKHACNNNTTFGLGKKKDIKFRLYVDKNKNNLEEYWKEEISKEKDNIGEEEFKKKYKDREGFYRQNTIINKIKEVKNDEEKINKLYEDRIENIMICYTTHPSNNGNTHMKGFDIAVPYHFRQVADFLLN